MNIPPRSKRLLNIELLRIVAMLMVLNLHANFSSFDLPVINKDGLAASLGRNAWESLCMCAVNVFVMISGWFGIKPSIRGFANFMWQVFYIVGICVIVEILFFNGSVAFSELMKPLGLYKGGGWFVPSYIVLYILAPILNKYVADTPEKNIRNMLVCFFLFELIWEFTGSVNFLHKGYAPISFIGLYILAAYLRKRKTKLKTGTALTGFFLCCIAITLTMSYDNIAQTTLLVSFEFYSSPFVIAAATFLLLSFTGLPESAFRKRPWEKLIPWLSTSCFAVYLIHVGTPFAFHLYVTTVKETYYAHPGIVGALCVAGIILGVFFGAILIDKPRVWIWRHFLLPLFKQKETSKTKESEAMVG